MNEFSNKVDIKVSKVVVSTVAGDKDRDCQFRVTLYGADRKTVVDKVNGTYGDMTFTNGVADITLKSGETKVAKDLPAGELGVAWYKTEELNIPSEFTASPKDSQNGSVYTIVWTNTRKPTTPDSKKSSSTTTSRSATPKTGDPTSIATVAAIALTGVTAVAFGRRRRRK